MDDSGVAYSSKNLRISMESSKPFNHIQPSSQTYIYIGM